MEAASSSGGLNDGSVRSKKKSQILLHQNFQEIIQEKVLTKESTHLKNENSLNREIYLDDSPQHCVNDEKRLDYCDRDRIVKPSPFLCTYLVHKLKAASCEKELSEKLPNIYIPSNSHKEKNCIDALCIQNKFYSEKALCNKKKCNTIEHQILVTNVSRKIDDFYSESLCLNKPIVESNSIEQELTESNSLKSIIDETNEKVFRNEINTSKSLLPLDLNTTTNQKTKSKHIRSFSDQCSRISVMKNVKMDFNKSLSPSSKVLDCMKSEDKRLHSSQAPAFKSFMEDGGHSITAEADGFFPAPRPGQDLLEYLNEANLSKTMAQLDRENAHFSIAEAVLAALEQVNSTENEKNGLLPYNENFYDESEEDLLNTKSKKYGRRKKLRMRRDILPFGSTSDEEPAATTTDSFIDSTDEPVSSDCEDHSQDSMAESHEVTSAENVAIAILKNYNSKLLPKASDLQWLVSEQDVPQKLLPMPTSVPIDPDAIANEEVSTSLLRGTADWAPPRPQLILTPMKMPKRKLALKFQKYRCAGCGLSVAEKFSSYFRLCHYLCRLFCTSCHSNKKSVIPARVIHLWSFNQYPVCNFSYELLNRMVYDPLFNLSLLNPKLYSLSRHLHQSLIYRTQLNHARAFISTCRRAVKEHAVLKSVPEHWYAEPHVYSIDDLRQVHTHNFSDKMKDLTSIFIRHIFDCQVCLGRGFICEICNLEPEIFPFQLDAVATCRQCGNCFHYTCFIKKNECPKCLRKVGKKS